MILSFVRALVSIFKTHRDLTLENLALRQQLAVLRRSVICSSLSCSATTVAVSFIST